MKILYIIHGFNIGGAEIIVTELAKNFSKEHEVTVLALDRSGSLESQLQAAGIKTKVLERKPGFYLQNFIRFFRFLNLAAPDLVHAHQYTPFFYAAIYKLLFFKKFKLILTEHGRHYPDIVSRRRKLGNYLLFKMANKITAVCNFTRSALIQNEIPKGYQVEVISNGTDLKELASKSLRKLLAIPESRKIIGYIGSFRKVKNPEMAILAFKILTNSLADVHLVMIGSGELNRRLNDLTEKLNLQERISFTGDLLPAKEYMSDIDILIQPSLSEAQSLVLLDALALGIPAIISSYGGGPEVIKNAYNGYLIDKQLPELYAEKLINCLSNKTQLELLSRNAKESANNFSMSKMLQRYHNLYQELGI